MFDYRRKQFCHLFGLIFFVRLEHIGFSSAENYQRFCLFALEKESLSTLENLLNGEKIILKQKIKNANLFIFCEQTREKRIEILAKKIFYKNHHFQIFPIDFDMSANRYLSLAFLDKKEQAELKHSLRVLKSPENLEKHHKIFEEKIEYLRKQGPKIHTEAVKKMVV